MADPRRDPPALIAIEPVQEGVPRLIHPIGSRPIVVGSPIAQMEAMTSMIDDTKFHIVKKSVVASSRDGKGRRRFTEGTRVTNHDAYTFGLIDDAPVVGVRDDGAAPENRMDAPPENRKSTKKSEA